MADTLLAGLAGALQNGAIRVIDLTQPLHPATPTLKLPPEWGASWPFSIETISEYDERGPWFYWNNFKCGEHTGTHFDAPVHWITGKDHPENTTDTIPSQKFLAPACVLDASAETAANPDFLVTIEFVEAWEAKHGVIAAGDWVLLRSGWGERIHDEAQYLNMHEDGAHTPGWHADVLPFLTEQRGIIGVGVETVGTDAGQAFLFNPPYPCHTLVHGANRFGLASLTNLDQLPPRGAILIAAPLKIVRGSGSPLRVLALAPA